MRPADRHDECVSPAPPAVGVSPEKTDVGTVKSEVCDDAGASAQVREVDVHGSPAPSDAGVSLVKAEAGTVEPEVCDDTAVSAQVREVDASNIKVEEVGYAPPVVPSSTTIQMEDEASAASVSPIDGA